MEVSLKHMYSWKVEILHYFPNDSKLCLYIFWFNLVDCLMIYYGT